MNQAMYLSQEQRIQQGLFAIQDVRDFHSFHAQHADLFRQCVNDDYFTISNKLQRGIATLNSYYDALNYMLLYGGFLYQCTQAITNYLFDSRSFVFDAHTPLHIVDYACGQGSAALIAMQAIHRHLPQQKNIEITLIEPSFHSLQRAKNLVQNLAQQLNLQVTLHTYQMRFDALPAQFIQAKPRQQFLHLFANIIDLFCFGGFKLDILFDKIKAQTADHRIIAVSIRHPKNFNSDDLFGFHALQAFAQANKSVLNDISYVNNVTCYELYQHSLYRVSRNKRMVMYACEF